MNAAELGAKARALLRQAQRASLATLLDGAPYASLVLVAEDEDCAPILLLSDLAEHAKNLKRDKRASLLIDGTAGLAEPLAGPRVTLLGSLERSGEKRLKERFLARHPSAAVYAGFGDFACYRMTVARAHLVEGFGRIDWIGAGDFLLPGAAQRS
jgi:putative heme iron utilization protein